MMDVEGEDRIEKKVWQRAARVVVARYDQAQSVAGG